MIPTSRHVEYALGYIGLGMINEASDELEAVSFDDRFAVPVLHARIELHTAAKHWDIVIGFASQLVETDPGCERGWIRRALPSAIPPLQEWLWGHELCSGCTSRNNFGGQSAGESGGCKCEIAAH